MKTKPINVYTSYYDGKGRPLVITCTTKHYNGIYTKGIAICSELDVKNGTFTKLMGNRIARGRSEKAFKTCLSSNPILRDEVVKIVKETGFHDNPKYLHKQQYNTLPGSQELKFILREEEFKKTRDK